jgi:DNA adenine methylase
MAENVFGYPGGKTNMADWILAHFPDHQCYVEPFAGSAAVLANKPPSNSEVLNDRDGDIVQFFEVLRDRPDELIAWLRDTPHSRELHEQYGERFYNGHRPDDPVERAGRFWYLRETSFGGKYRTLSGYNGSRKRNVARRTRNKRERLRRFSDRFDHVQIESLDYAAVFERYDSPETLFYCDPPYVEEGDVLYSGADFDHARFVDELEALAGYWCVSYTDLPDGLAEIATAIREKEQRYRIAQGDGWDKTGDEKLVMNYDPDELPQFYRANQTSVGDF